MAEEGRGRSRDRDGEETGESASGEPVGPRREPARPAKSDGPGRRKRRGPPRARDVEPRTGRRSGPRPARDISGASAVEGRPTPVRSRAARSGASSGAPTPVSEGLEPAAGISGAYVLQIVEVLFAGVRCEYFTWRGDVGVREHEFVIVEADRGQDLGRVKRAVDGTTHSCEGGCDHAHHGPVTPPARRVLRRAAPVDVERRIRLDEEEGEVRRRTREMVERHGLKMKVSEAEWQWDRNKLTVYFTADKRVDFRALVREMARTFRTRIELRQIGVRDEAKRLGGIGRCGRELCCRLWLPRIDPVTLQLAKDQGLSLNPAQISGACGRLMSCLHYEHEMYVQARKRFPKIGKRLRTERGEEVVTGWDMFRETVGLRAQDGSTRNVPLDELKAEAARARRGGRPRRGGSDAERARPADDA